MAIFENLQRDGHFTLQFPKKKKMMIMMDKTKMKKTKKNEAEEDRIKM